MKIALLKKESKDNFLTRWMNFIDNTDFYHEGILDENTGILYEIRRRGPTATQKTREELLRRAGVVGNGTIVLYDYPEGTDELAILKYCIDSQWGTYPPYGFRDYLKQIVRKLANKYFGITLHFKNSPGEFCSEYTARAGEAGGFKPENLKRLPMTPGDHGRLYERTLKRFYYV